MRTTSFINLFGVDGIKNIEIPIIQRDYAQGRQDDVVSRIRATFLAVLHRSLTGWEPVSLDFVYGDVTGGKLTPLDGQQRLTTLFLLHWYIATRAAIQDGSDDCLQKFTYETRYSSRDFCQRLVKYRPAVADRTSGGLDPRPELVFSARGGTIQPSNRCCSSSTTSTISSKTATAALRGAGLRTSKIPRSSFTSCRLRTWA